MSYSYIHWTRDIDSPQPIHKSINNLNDYIHSHQTQYTREDRRCTGENAENY